MTFDPTSRAAGRILLAEDNTALRAMLKFSLENAGFTLTATTNGREAWEQLQKNSFDILLTDHQMPELSGFELCEKISQSESLSHLPVIMLSSKGLELDPEKLASVGVYDVVPKPFSPRDLVTRIHKVLENHHRAPTPEA